MSKTQSKAKQKKEVQPTSEYKATVKVLGKTYSSAGSSLSEVIANLKPINCKGRGILVITHNGLQKERILTNILTYRLFNSHGLTKDVAIKNVSLMFQGI